MITLTGKIINLSICILSRWDTLKHVFIIGRPIGSKRCQQKQDLYQCSGGTAIITGMSILVPLGRRPFPNMRFVVQIFRRRLGSSFGGKSRVDCGTRA